MPIYEYACTDCGHTLDALQKIADSPLTDCPECGEATLKRQVSAPRFRLKGEGWYETDFKKENRRNLHGEKEGKEAGSKTSDKKTDAGKSSEKTTSKAES
jgi:putative FmdB family regulatory protein